MSELFGDDFLSITDDDGVDYELEVLGRVEYNGTEYLIVTSADPVDENEELEVSILKVAIEDGEEILCTIDDDAELETVYTLFNEEQDEEEE
jgi:uncharacterized protein YrzB (UPF0473 family)